MPPPENHIKCTWCTQTFSSVGNLNTHFRDFLPELPFYKNRPGPPYGSPFHPAEIVREHLRRHSLSRWRDQLDPKTPNKARARVLRAFALHAWSDGDPYRASWRDRKVDAVSRVRWGRIVDAVCARYPDASDKEGLLETVQEMVEDAVRRTFVGVEVEDDEEEEEQEEEEEVEEEEPPPRPAKRHWNKKAAAPEDASDDTTADKQPARRTKRQREKQPAEQEVPEDIEEHEDDDVRFMYDRDGTPTPGPNLLGSSFNSSMVKSNARDVGVNKSTNFGVKVAVNIPEASTKPSSSKACAITEPDYFFPLLVLSVAVFRATELVPAEIYTTWDEVKDAIATRLQEPDMKIVLVGCGGDKWDGVWDEEIWEDVKSEADLTAEPLVYSVKLKLGG